MTIVLIETSDVYPKWVIGGVLPVYLSSASLEQVRASVFAASGGVPVDPTGNVVQFGFTAGYAAPIAWVNGTWDTNDIGEYVAQCLVGPAGDVTLTAGTYYVWVQITASPEVIERQIGTLTVV